MAEDVASPNAANGGDDDRLGRGEELRVDGGDIGGLVMGGVRQDGSRHGIAIARGVVDKAGKGGDAGTGEVSGVEAVEKVVGVGGAGLVQ